MWPSSSPIGAFTGAMEHHEQRQWTRRGVLRDVEPHDWPSFEDERRRATDGRATPDATGSSLIVSAGLDIVLMGVCGTMREDVEKVSKQLRLESTAGIHVWKGRVRSLLAALRAVLNSKVGVQGQRPRKCPIRCVGIAFCLNAVGARSGARVESSCVAWRVFIQYQLSPKRPPSTMPLHSPLALLLLCFSTSLAAYHEDGVRRAPRHRPQSNVLALMVLLPFRLHIREH